MQKVKLEDTKTAALTRHFLCIDWKKLHPCADSSCESGLIICVFLHRDQWMWFGFTFAEACRECCYLTPYLFCVYKKLTRHMLEHHSWLTAMETTKFLLVCVLVTCSGGLQNVFKFNPVIIMKTVLEHWFVVSHYSVDSLWEKLKGQHRWWRAGGGGNFSGSWKGNIASLHTLTVQHLAWNWWFSPKKKCFLNWTKLSYLSLISCSSLWSIKDS